MRWLVAISLSLLGSSVAQSQEPSNETYEVVRLAGVCKTDELKQFSCEYKIGESLYVEITGVGKPDAGITVFKSDWEGDYYATFGLMHQCVIVKPGDKTMATGREFSMAFISPKNGKVYDNWQSCKAGL